MLYARHDGFDESFGHLVEKVLRAYLRDHDPRREPGWIVTRHGKRVGSIFCVFLDQTTARPRLFLLESSLRGQGLEQVMLTRCVTFACAAGYEAVQLWTHESHRAAGALYARSGWQMTGQRPVHSFGQDLVEQTWKLSL